MSPSPGGLLASPSMARDQLQAELARAGEDAARVYLEARGYELCAQNLRIGCDEADLVMRTASGETLVIVEVKTRSNPQARPEERVDASKERSLVRLARTLAHRGRLTTPLRIDVIAVSMAPNCPPTFHWFQNAVTGEARPHSRGR